MAPQATTLMRVYSDLKSASEQQHGRGTLSFNEGWKITEALATDLASAGIDPATIKVDQAVVSSGGYRLSSYRWDLAIIAGGIPRVVVEWKILGNRNNVNNRLDDIVAAAVNLRMPFEETGTGEYGPVLAALFIVDIQPTVARTRDTLEIFASRLRKMVHDRLIGSACVLYFDSPSQKPR